MREEADAEHKKDGDRRGRWPAEKLTSSAVSRLSLAARRAGECAAACGGLRARAGTCLLTSVRDLRFTELVIPTARPALPALPLA